MNALPGGWYHLSLVSLSTALWGHGDKVSVSKRHLDCLAFLWALSSFFSLHFSSLLLWCSFNLPALHGGGYWGVLGVPWSLGWSPYYLKDFTWNKLFFFLLPHNFTSELHCSSQSLSVSWGPLHGLTTNWTASNPHKQNWWSTKITIRFHLVSYILGDPNQPIVYPIKEAINPHANTWIPPAWILMQFNFSKICEY